MLLNAKQILFYTGGRYIIEPIDASEIISDITWDSRDVRDGCLFVALVGEKVDGHTFIYYLKSDWVHGFDPKQT